MVVILLGIVMDYQQQQQQQLEVHIAQTQVDLIHLILYHHPKILLWILRKKFHNKVDLTRLSLVLQWKMIYVGFLMILPDIITFGIIIIL